MFDNCKEVWNELLDEKTTAWKENKINLSQPELDKLIVNHPKKKTWYKNNQSHTLQNVSKRLIDSYTGFFSRCENSAFRNKKKGYPKEKKRVFSFTFKEYKNGCEILGNKLWLSKVGNIPIVLHREIPFDKISTITVKRKPSGKWSASICLDIFEDEQEKQTKEEIKQSIDLSHPIGIDVGCLNIVNLSNDLQIPNPKYYTKSLERLKMLQRRVSRKHIQVGKKVFSNHSNNRRKAVRKLTRFHEHIDNQRNDLQHKLSLWFTRNFTFFAVEKLNISNMLRNSNHYLAESIQDSSWGSLLQKIDYKSNHKLFKNPKTMYSSCKCCICNNIQENPLDKGLDNYICKTCGNVIQKDWNASINHLKDTLESLGFQISLIKVDDIYYLEVDNRVIQLNQIKSNDTVGHTEIKNTLVEKLPLLSYSKNKLASSLIEARNTSLDV